MGFTNVIQQSSFVLVFLLVQISTGYSRASFTVIRDQQDRFVIPNIPLLPLRGSCGAHYNCTCDPEHGTFVWSNNGGQLNGDCLSDQKLIERDRQSCTGFYQFHNGDLMRLLNMEVNSGRNKMTVNAPVNESTTCSLNWENSLYSYDGSNWFNFTNHVVQFDQIMEGTRNRKKILVFRLTNVNTFFQKWNSTLLKLKLECFNQNDMTQRDDGCVLFKVNGTFEQEYILTTLPTNSTNISTILTTQPFTPKSSPTSHQTTGTEATNCVTCGKREEQSDSISSQTTIIVVVVVVVVLVTLAIVTIILCRRRKRPKDSLDTAAETAGHLGDEVIYEDPEAVVNSQRVQENGNVGGQYMNTSGENSRPIEREYCSIAEPPHIYNQPGEQEGTPTNDQVNASSSEPFYNTLEENDHSEEQQPNEHQPSQSKSEEKTSDEPYYFVLDKNERLPKTASLNI